MNLPVSVSHWLASLGLQQYEDAFRDQEIHIDLLVELTDADLREIGVAPLGHRKRMLLAISAFVKPLASLVESESLQADEGRLSAIRGTGSTESAELRQLTVMFCDLVGSTALSTRLDAEDLRELIGRYQEIVARIANSYDGYVAQFLGDGALLYFGYPVAREDDVERAVRAARSIIDDVSKLLADAGAPQQLRIGIATGSVVLDTIGVGTTAAEISAIGETPYLAARLQSIAPANGILISDSSKLLLREIFELELNAALTLKGFDRPQKAWLVTGEKILPRRSRKTCSEFIGRRDELQLISDRWASALSRNGQVVLVSADAGMGKTRLCAEFLRSIRHTEHFLIDLHCSPFFSNSALHPFRRYLMSVSEITMSDGPEARRSKLEGWLGHQAAKESLHDELPSLQAFLDAAPVAPDAQEPGGAIESYLRTLLALLGSLLRSKPLVVWVEDIHWIDGTTQELLRRCIDQSLDKRILFLATTRPGYFGHWSDREWSSEVDLHGLTPAQSHELVRGVAGEKLSVRDIEQLVVRADGVPLFLEELARSLATDAGASTASRLDRAVPSTLQDLLAERLDRLASKEFVQVAAAIGREFRLELMADVLRQPLSAIGKALEEAIQTDLLVHPQNESTGNYSFKHALICDAAYNSLVRERRGVIHRRIAAALIKGRSYGESIPDEILAHHFEAAGDFQSAIQAWEAAGKAAAKIAADADAARYFERAIKLLGPVDNERNNFLKRIDLLEARGRALFNAQGYGVEAAHECWREVMRLTKRLDDPVRTFAALAGISPIMYSRGKFHEHIALLGSVKDSGLESGDSLLRASFQTLLSVSLLLTGRFDEATENFMGSASVFLSTPSEQLPELGGSRSDIVNNCYFSRCLLYAGNVNQAFACLSKASNAARDLGHAPALCWVLVFEVLAHLVRKDSSSASRVLEELLPLARHTGVVTRVSTATIQQGIIEILTGEPERGVAHAREGILGHQAHMGSFHVSEWAALTAASLIDTGEYDRSDEFLRIAESIEATTDEHFYYSEIIRLRGRLAQQSGNSTYAATLYREGFNTARAQGAHLFALRAATDLALLTPTIGEGGRALALLETAVSRVHVDPGFVDLVLAQKVLSKSNG
ncbi:MAG: adenylate/guanylate cyclase domain-containing protein [Burkholderiaceae bacterium]